MASLPLTFALEPTYKQNFAQFIADGFSPFVAAIRLWPNDPGLASMVAVQWPEDPYVIAWGEHIKDEAAAAKKPATKDAHIKRIELRLPRMSDDNYLRGERLIAEMSGHIEKATPPSLTVNNTQQVVERVMVVRDHGSDSAWEDKLARQQSKLIEGNV